MAELDEVFAGEDVRWVDGAPVGPQLHRVPGLHLQRLHQLVRLLLCDLPLLQGLRNGVQLLRPLLLGLHLLEDHPGAEEQEPGLRAREVLRPSGALPLGQQIGLVEQQDELLGLVQHVLVLLDVVLRRRATAEEGGGGRRRSSGCRGQPCARARAYACAQISGGRWITP